MPHKATGKTVLVISSHVVRGAVGSRVSSFVLERMGFTVWELLTVTMTWQPRHGRAHRLHVSDDDFMHLCTDIATSPFADEIDAVISGYFVSPSQVASTAQLIRKLKAKRPDIAYLCDPVMGDESGLYIALETATAIKTELLPISDIIKPNRSELEWICGRKLEDHQAVIAAMEAYPASIKLVTSAPINSINETGNLLINEPVNGLGDLTASLFFSHILHNIPPSQALQRTTASVFDCLNHTLAQQANELILADSQYFLTHPTADIALTTF